MHRTVPTPARPLDRPLDRPLARLLVVLAAALVALLVTAASVGAAPDAKAPAPETIVKVTGNASEGFGIEHYDGSSTFPPTHSEAMAECQEYSAKVGRIRCRVEVKTWYRDLVATKRALKYAHRS
ncbi:hypothetical protein [uncultured Nocardioides sp.]|jgi:hypothetical protein|uniref:hypothetical protein n=1 Tax=uncultured Nocardioides sp. TaxID=198441 RepID=UPI000A9F384A|nr:hypothetical protein [uncultured Nocardioides sp.]